MLLGLAPLSWIFSVSVTAAPTFAKAKVSAADYGGPDIVVSQNFGLIENGTAHAFGAFNCFLTTLGIVGILLMHFQFKIKGWQFDSSLALQIIMYISLWCALFTFYVQETPVPCGYDFVDCGLGPAGGAQVFNVLMLIGINVLLFLTSSGTTESEAPETDVEAQTPAQKFETETHLPDGTIEREVEITNQDGSKTITKTIEKPEDDFIEVPEDIDSVGSSEAPTDEVPQREE